MAGKLKRMTEEGILEAMSLYRDGFSAADIADYFGGTRSAMWDLLRRRGLVFRPQLRYGADNHFYRGGKNDTDRAHNLIDKAVARGRIVRPDACETCGASGRFKDGRSAIQAHHDDYNKPMQVRWLCQPCHHEWHKANVAVPLRTHIDAAK